MRPVVSLPLATAFNEVVCLDLKEFKHNKVWIFHLIDASTRYTAARLITTKKKDETYHSKLDAILELPQFEKVQKIRKNAKHPVLKEEERILSTLNQLKSDGKMEEELFDKLKPARLYGLSKVHKDGYPVRPVLSMPRSAYHQVGM